MKNEKGITLIALVITIIVLLILAGISIAMLTGDNGLLTRSKEGAAASAVAGAKDEVSLEFQNEMAEYLKNAYTEGATVTEPSAEAIVTGIGSNKHDCEVTGDNTTRKILIVYPDDATGKSDADFWAEATLASDGLSMTWTNK